MGNGIGYCPSDCDWGDWGSGDKPCPLHGGTPEALGRGVTVRVAGAPGVSMNGNLVGDAFEQLALNEDVAAPSAEDRDPEVLVFSLEGAKAALPGGIACPAKRLISILGAGSVTPRTFKPGWEDVLELSFDDVTGPMVWSEAGRAITASPATLEHADKILDFVEKDPDADYAVHCAAGISRSMAVAAFISRVLGHRLVLRGGSDHEETGNPLVYSLLIRAWLKREDPAGDSILDDVTMRGSPRVFASPILERVIRIPAKPTAAPAATSAVATILRPRPLLAWGAAEGRMRDGKLKTELRKLRLKLVLRVANPIGRFLHRHRLHYGLGRFADGLWLVWSGAWDIVSVLADKLSGRG